MALMISVSGIRGVFGTDLTPENLARFTAAYGTWIDRGTVVVGRDTRVTGQICEDIVVSTLQSVGCDVVKVGVVPTPTVAMSVLEQDADGAIILSASHNPAEWNALKLLNEKSEFLDSEQGQAVIYISEKHEFNYQQYNAIGSVFTDKHAIDKHIERILELPYIDSDKISQAGFSVAIDPVNGTGGIALPPLLEALGVQTIHKINEAPTGIFAHNPEPLPEHMQDICALVRNKSCDLGIVTDPDADRLALVTNTGELFGEENTQAAAFDFILNQRKGNVATNLSSSRVADDIAKKYGQTCYRSSVGEINVVKKMQEVDAVIGGEGNGGVINPDLHYGRDALVGVAMVLQMLAERDITLAEYHASLPNYHISKKKLQLDGIDGDQVLENAKKLYADHDLITIDGVKIHFDEGWVHLRKSNTEPIIRVYSEAATHKLADELGERVKNEVLK
ncbi:phosphoglucosamine mutase [Aliifodinibius sp. S!AR15-10]|uniref:phosphoglucosamine mutase n=1 Tax=Aliifodinibius sp. S!AR15-10 TaxID=2950437 RepID=UPI00285E9EB6|nr:phosphoglucosamine mutase [Aliifodinibius sp. S!AR15-10]MDR8391745.1 phosphoglucosamine mutase [Aliifodinibius sp. S!AR15-10]